MLSSPMVSRHAETTSSVELPASQLDNTHDQTTSVMACHHIPWTTYTIGRRWACHVIIALGKHSRLHYALRSNAIITLGQHKRSDDVERSMPSFPLDSINGWTTTVVSCYHLPWKHTRSNDVSLNMLSSPLECTHDRTTSGV